MLELDASLKSLCLSQISLRDQSGWPFVLNTCTKKIRFYLFEACTQPLGVLSLIFDPQTHLGWPIDMGTCPNKIIFYLFEACICLEIVIVSSLQSSFQPRRPLGLGTYPRKIKNYLFEACAGPWHSLVSFGSAWT